MTEEKIHLSYGGAALCLTVSVIRRSEKWLICLHGIQSNRHLFDSLIQETTLSAYSVLAVDFVGFGDSDKPENFSYDIGEQAEIIAKIIIRLRINRPVIIGHSLGGMVGTLLLDERESKIQALINCEGNLTIDDAGLSRIIAKQTLGDFAAAGYNEIKDKIRHSDEPGAESRAKWLELIPNYVMYHTSQSIIKYSQDKSFSERFYSTNIPVLYLYGDKNLDKAKHVPSTIPKAEIPSSGHFMFLDNPGATLKAIASYLSSIDTN